MSTKSKDVSLSKTLSWLLRHAAEKEGLNITSEGFVAVEDLLKHRSLRGRCTFDDIKRIVENNDKQRFELCDNNGVLKLRANQGHSLNVVGDLMLEPITLSSNLNSNIIHGTYMKFWDKIKREGLCRMTRNHIHFATGLPSDDKVISGIRKTCEIFIYIDLKQALLDGIQFYRSANGVILSAGDKSGFIKPKYFIKVVRPDGAVLNFYKDE